MQPRKLLYPTKIRISLAFFALLLALIGVGLWGSQKALARPTARPIEQASPLHPTFPLLDQEGSNVLDSGKAVSTMQTCGACHDTGFIEEHSYHADVGLSDYTTPGEVVNGRAWDTSPGFFGNWNPMVYRYLSPEGDERIDLSTAEWLQELGPRHAGGGPGVTSRQGDPLTELSNVPGSVETNTLDPETGDLVPWDWQESGVVEMNCFLCHTTAPNNDARIQSLRDGKFGWASTATLVGSGIVEEIDGEYRWNPKAFDADGELQQEFVNIHDPANDNCGLCHGLVHDDLAEPLVAAGCSPERWRTETTGQIVSPQRLADSGMNLADKLELIRSWDIHAERLVSCTDCHFSLNNPVYYQETEGTRPDHLTFDPRRLEIGEYLYQPLHQFARGQSAQSSVAPELKDTMRRCESCHSIEATHDWLPYKERHVSAVSCESCHIPKIYSFGRQKYDWTVLKADGEPQLECRGIEGKSDDLTSLVTGFEPVLMPRKDVDGETKLAPYNLITSWYWIYDDPPRPVRLEDLQAAWFDDGSYHADIVAMFDQNGDGALDETELIIDSGEKEALIKGRLEQLGLQNPRIVGEIQPYSINHNVTNGEWATRDCQTCHSNDSRVTQPIELASYVPADVMPEFVADSNTSTEGVLYQSEDDKLYYQPVTGEEGLYVMGLDNVAWVDLLGALIFMSTLLGVLVHGGLRVLSAYRKPGHEVQVEKVYMYSVYERLWHWLQTFVILGLLFTGLIIHKPDIFGIFSFRYVVLVHNIFAAILLVNAALALFYHLASGEIRQYIPRPRGFFDQAITQAKFYLRGIFKDEPHPTEKKPEKKLNPLQQVTYFGLLNVLLPLQIITGALIWGAQRWPNLANSLGGLPFLSPFHTLISWLLASFIVAHVYLTTTGHTATAAIKAMMVGWDELEVHVTAEEEAKDDNLDPIPVE